MTEDADPGRRPHSGPEMPAAGRGAVRVALGRGEWMLALPPAPVSTAELRSLAVSLARVIWDEHGSTADRMWAPVPLGTMDRRLGPLAAYFTGTRAFLCFPDDQAAESAVSTMCAIGAASAAAAAGHDRSVSITLVACHDMPEAMHPAALVAAPLARVHRYLVCDNLMSRRFADGFERMGTALVAYRAGRALPLAGRLLASGSQAAAAANQASFPGCRVPRPQPGHPDGGVRLLPRWPLPHPQRPRRA